MSTRRGARIFLWLLLLLLSGALAATLVGPFPISLGQLLSTLGLGSAADVAALDPRVETVLLSLRLPRIAAALLVGAALSGAGTVFQSLFRNPLVSPDILGVSTGAGLGAATGIFLALPVFAVQGLAFVAGLGTVFLVYQIAGAVRGHEPTLVLVLVGVVLGTLAGACISLLKLLADPYDQLPAITFWLLGSLADVRVRELAAAAPAVLIGMIPLVLLRWRMNVLSLGEQEAAALGVEPGRLRALFIASATLMTAAVVAVAGVIAWVGLVIPHIARMLVGPDFRRLLPVAMLLGAGFLLLVDTLARSLASTETPLGILTAFVGGPVFLWLLVFGRRDP